MGGYTKLFNSILHSTIWREPDHTRLVWITMLAMSDRNGEVLASVPGLADASRVSLELCVDALKTLSSPDKWSRTTDHEGRRIKEIDGGWMILNHQSYREKLSSEERREYNRRKQAEYRERTRKAVNDMSITVNHNEQCGHITEAEADTDTKKNTSTNVLVCDVAIAPPPVSESSGLVFAKQSGTWDMPAKSLAEYVATYRFDVRAELLKAALWLRNNKDRRPRTNSGLKRFLTRWLNNHDERRKPTSDLGGRVKTDDLAKKEAARSKMIREARKNGELSGLPDF